MIEMDQLRGLSLDDLQEAMQNISDKRDKSWQLTEVAVSTRNSELIYRLAIDLMALEMVQSQIVDAIKEKTI